MVASLLSIGSVLLLYYIQSDSVRLGFAMALCAFFAIALGLVTNAKRVDIFSSSVAYVLNLLCPHRNKTSPNLARVSRWLTDIRRGVDIVLPPLLLRFSQTTTMGRASVRSWSVEMASTEYCAVGNSKTSEPPPPLPSPPKHILLILTQLGCIYLLCSLRPAIRRVVAGASFFFFFFFFPGCMHENLTRGLHGPQFLTVYAPPPFQLSGWGKCCMSISRGIYQSATCCMVTQTLHHQ